MEGRERGNIEGDSGGDAGVEGEVEGIELEQLGPTSFGGSEEVVEVGLVGGVRRGGGRWVATACSGGALYGNVGRVEHHVDGCFNVGKDGVDAGAGFGGARDGGERVEAEIEGGGEGGNIVLEGCEGSFETGAEGAEVGVLVGSGECSESMR